MKSIYDKKYKRVGIMSNEAQNGIRYSDDELTTSIDDGTYVFTFTTPKTTHKVSALAPGNYIETYTRNGKQLLLSIVDIDEDGREKVILCEDTTIQTLNSYVDALETPKSPQRIDYYLNHALENSSLEVLVNESTESLILEFGSEQRILERLREIAAAFGVELDFDIKFSPGSNPKRYVSLLKERVEDYKGFRVSSDDLLLGIDRKITTTNIATKVKVKGKAIEGLEAPSDNGGNSATGGTGTITQPPATQFDSSKASGATALSTSGWNEAEVNQFRMNAADPPHVTGAYIDKFLRDFYPDSPLVGQGALIKEMSDYFGVSVGAAMGVWAKETTFGRGQPGRSHYNYGCVMWTQGSPYQRVWYGDRYWNDYPNARTGIAAWFKLLRYNYIETGQSNYGAFLNKYSPPFENNQSTFKNLMWGALKSFGYNMSASVIKANYSSANDDPMNLNTSGNTGPAEPSTNTFIETAITEAHRIAALKRAYQWGGNGNPSWDCSGFMQACFQKAGKRIDHRWTTYTMWAQQGGHFKRITRAELQRGDLIMYDTGYTTPGDVNHVGLYLGPSVDAGNSVIHAGNPVGITQRANSMSIIGYVRVIQ